MNKLDMVEAISAKVGGMDDTIRALVRQLNRFCAAADQMVKSPSAGVVLSGTPGCGKTLLAKMVAGIYFGITTILIYMKSLGMIRCMLVPIQ